MKDTKVIGFKAGESEARRAVIAPDSAASISRANIVYGVSEGEIEGFVEQLRSVILDNTPVQSSSGNINLPDVEVQTRWGTNDQTHLEGFPAVVNEVGYSGVEIVSDYNFIHYINDLNVDAARIRLQWGKIFKSNPDNGDMGGYRIDYAIDVQTDGAGFVEMIRSALDDKTSSGYERTHQIQLPEAEEGWEIRIRRLTPNTNVEHIGDKMYIRAVGEIIDLKLRYPNTAIIGLKFNAERFTNIPKADFRLKGKKIKVPANYDPVTRTYATVGEGTTGGVWNGVFKTAYSNNPAWIFYDIMLSPRYGLGTRIDASMVNKWALYGIARHCDTMVPDGQGGMEPRFACNVYLSSQFEAFDCITQLASVFRGLMHWDGSAIVVHPDTPEDPTFTYTRANIVGDFVYSGTRARDRHSIFTVAFDDPRNNYKTEKEVVSDTNAIAELGVRIGNLSAFGCTSRGQAQRVGRAALLKEQNETRMVNFAVGLDGFIPVTGKIIEIADNILAGRAIGGRVAHVSADLKVISLDRKIEAQAGDRLAVNNEEGIQESREILSVAGAVVTVTSPFTSLAAENVWALETEDLDLMRFRVLSVTENKGEDGSLNFTISAIQHNKDTQEIADNSSHFEAPIFSKNEIYTQVPVESLTIASENIINQGIDITNVVISWPQAKGAVRYELEWRRDKGSWIKTPDQYGNEFTIENVYHGNYAARIVAVNAIDVKSLPTLSPITPINSKFTEPAILASFTATGSQFGMIFNWSFPNTGAENAAQTEIRVAYLSDYSDEKLLGNYAYPLNRAELSGLHGNLKIYAKARIIDRNGVEGAWTPWIFGTTLADPDVLLDVLNGHIGLGAIDNELAGKLEIGTVAAETAALAQLAAEAASQAAINASSESALAQVSADAAKTAADSASNAVAQEVYDRQIAVAGEASTRREAVIALNDGLTQETIERTDGDATLFSNINTYKASNDNALASVRNQTTVNTDALSSQAEQLTQLDAGLTDTAQLLSSNIVRVNDIDGKVESHAEQLTNINASLQGKADANVLNSLSSTVTEIDGKVVANTQELSAQSTRLANAELGVTNNASAISKTYTKTEADEVIAGEVNSYDASLVIGGANLWSLLNASITHEQGSFSTDIIRESEEELYIHLLGFTDNTALIRFDSMLVDTATPFVNGEDVTLSFEYSGTNTAARISAVYAYAGSLGTYISGVVPAAVSGATWTRFTHTFKANGTGVYGVEQLFGLRFNRQDGWNAGDTLAIRHVQLQRGTKATTYSKADALSRRALEANATAIQQTKSDVSRIDGVTTAHSGQLTSLSASIDTINGNLIRKADATALNELSADVSDINGRVVAQALQTTNLISRVEGAEGSILNVQHTVSELDASTSTALQQLKSSTDDTGEVSRLLNGAAAIFEDFNFSLGFNGVEVYNNLYNGTVAAAWQDKTPDNPIVATRQLGFTHTGAADPAYGGFFQSVVVRPNAVFVHKFVAKLPIGYYFNPASNAIGDGGENYILGSAAGTGKFETYYIVVRAGATGSFSSTGFVYVNGNGLPLSWVLASATIYDCSDSKLVPTSVSNAIATAQSTANTATSNLSALADRTDTLQAQLSIVDGKVATKLDASVISRYYTKTEADEAAAGEVRKFEANLSIGGTNLWSTTNASQYVELGAASFQLVDTASEYYQIHKQNSGLTRVGFTSLLVAPTTIITSGDEYVLSFYAHTSSAEARLSKIYCYFGGGGTFIAYEPTEVLNHSGWTRFEIKLRANGGDTSQLAQLLVFDLDDARGFAAGSIFAIRDVQMQRGNKATAYSKANDLLAKQAAANATAIQQTKSDVIAVDNRVTASSANLDQVSARADNALKLLKIEDTRYTNAPPQWYWDNYPYRTVKEFKENAYIGAEGFLGYAFCYLETDVYYGDPSGGAIIQTATSASNPADYVQRVSTGLDTWGGWSQPLKQLKTNIEGVAYATQLLNSRVDSVDGRITAEAEETSNLFASLNQKIDLSVTNKDALVDLTAARYNQDTYYPVGINLNENKRHIIQINTALNNLSHPYWATHGGGFSVTCGWEVNRTGWGAAAPDRVVNVFSYGFTGRSPIGGLDQIIQPSWEVVWLRGGGVYNISIPRTSSIIYGDNNGTLYWTDGVYSDTRLAKAYDANTVPVAVNQLSAATASAVNTLKINVQSINGVQSAQATQLTDLNSTVNGHTTSIQTQSQVTDGIQAKFTVKINNNGYATGFGLISTTNDAVPSSAFLVDADAFAVGKAGAGTKPFVVVTAGQTIEGITYPAGGTYINSAKIADLTVTSAKIADLGVTTAKIANLAVDGAKIANAAITTAKIGDLQVDTLKIANNAITVPVYSYVNGIAYIDSQVWTTAQSIWSPCSNGVTLFFFNFSYDCRRQDTRYAVKCRILKNGVIVKPEFTIFYFEADYNNANIKSRPAGTLSLNHADDSGVDGTFELQFYVSAGNGWDVANRYTSSLTVRK